MELGYEKSQLKDSKGRYLVQGLFLEDRYDPDMAIFTFDGEDKLYKGKTFISLKKRYIEAGDPVEYNFANTWLYDWDHWQRLCNNKVVSSHIEKWRNELALSLMADGVENVISMGTSGDSYQASKWLAEGGWIEKKRGRPSKEELEGEIKRRADAKKEFSEDFQLLQMHRDK